MAAHVEGQSRTKVWLWSNCRVVMPLQSVLLQLAWWPPDERSSAATRLCFDNVAAAARFVKRAEGKPAGCDRSRKGIPGEQNTGRAATPLKNGSPGPGGRGSGAGSRAPDGLPSAGLALPYDSGYRAVASALLLTEQSVLPQSLFISCRPERKNVPAAWRNQGVEVRACVAWLPAGLPPEGGFPAFSYFSSLVGDRPSTGLSYTLPLTRPAVCGRQCEKYVLSLLLLVLTYTSMYLSSGT